jgi:hypothetical protein
MEFASSASELIPAADTIFLDQPQHRKKLYENASTIGSTQEYKWLPQKQVKKIAYNFCKFQVTAIKSFGRAGNPKFKRGW